MKNRFKKILTVALAGILTVATFAGCGGKEEEHPMLPDYSANDEKFMFFCYGGLWNGEYKIVDSLGNETEVSYGDMRTVEKYKEHKECGFDMVMARDYDIMDPWEESSAKLIMDRAYEAGITKCIVTDVEMRRMTESYDKLLGEGEEYMFQTYEDLLARIKECISVYKDHPAFFGINLRDEPNWRSHDSFELVYKAIRQAEKELGMKEIYLHMNQLPLGAGGNPYSPEGMFDNLGDSFSYYVEEWLRRTGANRISVDDYPYRGSGLISGYYNTLQTYRKMCDKYGADLTYVIQSIEAYSGENQVYRAVDKADMYQQLFGLIGFGVDHFAYYTYMPTGNYTATGTMYTDNGSFLTREGEKTNIWYWGQEVLADAQKFAPVALSYDFKGSKFYLNQVVNHDNSVYLTTSGSAYGQTPMLYDNSYEHKYLKGIEMDNDAVLTTEMYDEENDLYMYMVQNAVDPGAGQNGRTEMNVTATFDSQFTWVAEYDCGNLTYVKLDNGVYKNLLSAGQQVFLIPLK